MHSWVALVLPACSLGRVMPTECTSNKDCRLAFGAGAVCGESGLCGVAEEVPRCQIVPDDLTYPIPKSVEVLGSVFNWTSETHRARAQTVALVLDEVRGREGLGSTEFALVQCTTEENPDLDDWTQDEAAVEMATYLASQVGAKAIVGPSSSGQVEEAWLAIESTGALMISPSATSPRLTGLDDPRPDDEDPGLLWRTAAPDDLQGAVIARDMFDRGVRDAMVIYDSEAYGDGLKTAFDESFRALGSGAGTDTYRFTGDPTAAIAQATDDLGQVDEVLFIGDSTAVATFVNTIALSPSWDDVPLFLTDTAANADVLLQTAKAVETYDRIRITAPAVPDTTSTAYTSFSDAYREAYGVSRTELATLSFAPHTWDATWMVLYGVAWGRLQEGIATGRSVARGLRQLSEGDAVLLGASGWADARAAFEEGTPIDVTGASGALDYDPATEETTTIIEVLRIAASRDGFVCQYRVDPATGSELQCP